MNEKILCNYCFIMECYDLDTPEEAKKHLDNTKCTGVEKGQDGNACIYASKLIVESGMSLD